MANEENSKDNDGVPIIEDESIIVFQYNDQLGEFEELELEDDVPLYELLDPEFILLFIDDAHFRVYLWHGSNVTTRMKFVAAKLTPSIRDKFGIGYKITTVDEGDETLAFKILVGLEEKVDYEQIQEGPSYEGKEADMELLQELTREKIILILEKIKIPEGFERKLVIVKNKIYAYREFEKDYMGTLITERQLFPLKEEISDGTYLAEGYIVRMLFSFNNVILIELLQKGSIIASIVFVILSSPS
ncbi:MAG: hypothetical protein P8Y97_16905 [Candidatus Lokiarchaeota archaeon]